MNRNLRQQDSSGSLELMLDILSNVFGAVILIACLLAILPRHSAPPVLWAAAEARSQMVERRIESAQQEVGKLQREIDRLQQIIDPSLARMLGRRSSLRDTLAGLKAQGAELSRNEETEAEARALAALGKREDLEYRLQKLQQLLASAEILSAASKRKAEFLEERLRALQEQLNDLSKGRVQSVRFPREKGRAGSPFPVILRYGKIYPLRDGPRLRANNAIKETRIDGDSVRTEPIQQRGHQLPMATATVSETLQAVKAGGMYVTVYVYSDSHRAFQELKELIFKVNIRYGLEFVESDRRLIFSSEGSKPPEL